MLCAACWQVPAAELSGLGISHPPFPHFSPFDPSFLHHLLSVISPCTPGGHCNFNTVYSTFVHDCFKMVKIPLLLHCLKERRNLPHVLGCATNSFFFFFLRKALSLLTLSFHNFLIGAFSLWQITASKSKVHKFQCRSRLNITRFSPLTAAFLETALRLLQ